MNEFKITPGFSLGREAKQVPGFSPGKSGAKAQYFSSHIPRLKPGVI